MAQLVAHLLCKQGVRGSSPLGSTAVQLTRESPARTPCRLLVTGASGSGTTTLGRALASDWAVPHADVDDYFWRPTSPAYVAKRPVEDRLRLMAEVFLGRDAWVLTGSVMGWG